MYEQKKQKIKNENLYGRFLFDIDGQFESQYNIYQYSKHFGEEYKDILNKRRDSSRVSSESIANNVVDLEFSHNQYDTFIWKIIIHCERYGPQSISRGVLPRKGEQYEIVSTKSETHAVYYELTNQNALMRKQYIEDLETLKVLQGLIEYMTDTRNFYKNASGVRGDSTRTHVAIEELEKNKSRNYVEEKNLRSLRSHLFKAGFPSGLPSNRNKTTLF